ncbi:hypothetical protein [Porphyromonas pogonae]|uniref:hypothetical protein n=1 Tax=Porphyromonas pogonae TaxID=867595 RepID=UPI002E77AD2E|nr:hypothetical protein [Porphyromonas pogonae]
MTKRESRKQRSNLPAMQRSQGVKLCGFYIMIKITPTLLPGAILCSHDANSFYLLWNDVGAYLYCNAVDVRPSDAVDYGIGAIVRSIMLVQCEKVVIEPLPQVCYMRIA